MDEAIWSRQLLELVIETIADGVLVLSKEGRAVFANRSAERILGLRRSDILGRAYNDPAWKITTVDGKPFPEENLAFAQVLRTGKPVYGVELSIERPDGRRITLSVNSAPIRDREGGLVNVVNSFTDITEHKQAEEALRESEELYRTIIEYSNDWIWTVDTEGRFLFFNKRAEEVSGYRLEDWRGKTFAPLIVEEDLPHVVEVFQKTLAGQPQQYEVRVKAHDGKILALSVNTAPIYSKGAVVGTVSFGRDITERKRAEEELRESEERYRRLSEAAFEGIVIHERGKILELNQTLALMLGYEPSELIGRSGLDMVTPEYKDVLMQQILSGSEEPYEAVAIRKDGTTFPVEIRGRTTQYKGRLVRVGAVRDITERKHAEEALRQKDREIRQAYVDVFNAVTGGRLIIMTGEEIKETLGRPLGESYVVSSFEKLSEARSKAKIAVQENFPSFPDLDDLIVAFSEAATNSVKHAGRGTFQVYEKDSVAQILISDSGPGIDFKALPKATLLAGFSTKQTLGMGFTVMLELCDRVLLATEPGSTLVLLEAKSEDLKV